jgi:hypothetical protein
MSEITKLYKNAGIKKEVIKGCYDYYSKLGIDIWKENDCAGKNCDTCKKDKSIKRYPPFTAEKQIGILKLLTINRGILIKQNVFFTNLENPEKTIGTENIDSNFDEGFASLINILWQDLTEEEKQQVKGILK